jgi:hypothetical protein
MDCVCDKNGASILTPIGVSECGHGPSEAQPVDTKHKIHLRTADTVKLRLSDLKTNLELVVDNAPMTYENRMAVYKKRPQSDAI